MGDLILTRAEIDALAEQSERFDSLYDQELTDFFQRANFQLENHLSQFLQAKVNIDGFYVEGFLVENRQINHIHNFGYIFPVEFTSGDSCILLLEQEARALSDTLNVPISRASKVLVEEFVVIISEFLTEQTNHWRKGKVFPAVKASMEQIRNLPQGLTHLARYNIGIDDFSIELFWLFPKNILGAEFLNRQEIPQLKRRINKNKAMKKTVKVTPVEFETISTAKTDKKQYSIGLVNDVDMQITAELGHTQMRLSEIMKLKIGDVITLDKAAGDPADVYIADQNIAKAEITVVDDHLGLRILEIETLKNI